ncbi:MAG: ECF-type sigma factor [Wenzhouxiangellaceae bacterium]
MIATRGNHEITHLLVAIRSGEPDALNSLFEIVYSELHRLAHRTRHNRHGCAAVETTTLVHETYIKLLAASNPDWTDRRHFFNIAARAMRQIIVDQARRAQCEKRGGSALHLSLDGRAVEPVQDADLFISLDSALDELALKNERLVRVVELHFYAGLTFGEIGAMFGVSERTIKRDWRLARAFLYQQLDMGSA